MCIWYFLKADCSLPQVMRVWEWTLGGDVTAAVVAEKVMVAPIIGKDL